MSRKSFLDEEGRINYKNHLVAYITTTNTKFTTFMQRGQSVKLVSGSFCHRRSCGIYGVLPNAATASSPTVMRDTVETGNPLYTVKIRGAPDDASATPPCPGSVQQLDQANFVFFTAAVVLSEFESNQVRWK